MRKLILMRGISGAGKSTEAKRIAIKAIGDGALTIAIYSTDEYFIDNQSNYNFDHNLLAEAHAWNINRTNDAMRCWTDLIIVDNTNTTHKEMEPYKSWAESYRYEVQEVVMGKEELLGSKAVRRKYIEECAARNTHNVPLEVIEKQAQRLEL